jgi:NAD(P)-dependent dehydrogenase (short-subunit alcohol dehydrogenase family)
MMETNSKRRRVWFITGTSSGMGYAATKAALEHGDLVAATARDTSAIFPGTGMLAAVKQALGGATQAMSAELAPLGIKFTQIEPGGLAYPVIDGSNTGIRRRQLQDLFRAPGYNPLSASGMA